MVSTPQALLRSPWTRILLWGAAIVYAVALATWLSAHHLMLLDEFFAWNLLSDPSWHHLVASWAHGADSGGILYYALLWPLVHLFHKSVLVARIFSALCYVLSAMFWWRALARFMNAQAAALGVLLVWLSSGLVLVYIAQVRFYTPLLLFASLAVLTTLRCADEGVSPKAAALQVASAHACLVLIHMLGILYSALILAASLLCLLPRRRAFLIAGSVLTSWLALLPCRAAIRAGSANATSQLSFVLRDVLRFELKAATTAPVRLIALIGLLWLLYDAVRKIRSAPARARAALLGPVLCAAFLAGPFSLYLLSIFGRPLGAARYLLPYYMSLGTVCAYAIWRLQAVVARPFASLIAIATIALAAYLHVVAISKTPRSPTLDLGNLDRLAQGKPVVVLNEQTFFELQYYRSNRDLQFHFLTPPVAAHATGMMSTVAAQGYFLGSFDPVDVFERAHPEFVVLANPESRTSPWVLSDPTCHAAAVGTVRLSGNSAAVYDVHGCHP